MSKLSSIVRLANLFITLSLCAAPLFAGPEDEDAAETSQTTGLMWNRTGLPAVFPLQVKTPVGQNYFLKLIDDETGEDALAAYIPGGDFFKVLVPPGVFRLRLAAGDVWQGEERLFGPGKNTHVFDLEKPLTFKIRSLSIKAGHMVNVSETEPGQTMQAAVKDQFICQGLIAESRSRMYRNLEGSLGWSPVWRGWAKSGQLKYWEQGLFSQLPGRKYLEYDFPLPRYTVQSQYCG